MKKIFTIISLFVLALGAQAQTVVSLGGLTNADFTFDATYYETSSKTIGEETYPSFTYKGGSQYSALELTGKNVKFNYKNSGKKADFFILTGSYVTVGGKGAQVIVTNVKKGNKIAFKVAAKADASVPSFAVQNAIWESGDASTLTVANEFIDLVYVVTADGDVTLSESNKGFNIESVTVDDGTGPVVIPDGTYCISFDGQTAANKLEYPEGFTLQITGNLEKTIGKGSNLVINEKTYQSMKVSNGAENTLTLPEGKVASGIKFYSYVNSEPNNEKVSYWKEIAGVTFESVDLAGGAFASFLDLENPDVREYEFNGKANKITFTNTGIQCCYVIEVTIETGEPTEVTEVKVKGGSTGVNSVKAAGAKAKVAGTVNLAGQQVGADYKGVVIKDGKKVMQ